LKEERSVRNLEERLSEALEKVEAEKVEEKFKLGIRVYEPSEAGIWRVIRQPVH